MLVICYGMAKSGSTLAYELVKGVLESAGHSQEKVDSVAFRRQQKHGNYMAEISREALEDAFENIGPDRIVAAKTHMPLPDELYGWAEEMQAARKLQVIASYRDPRDICLSLIDHSKRSRELGQDSYAALRNLDRASRAVEKAIRKFRQWASLEGSLRLFYETVAFSPDEAIDAIERALGVSADHEQAKQHAFEDSFTQRNKASARNRYIEEMDDAQKAEMLEKFGPFIADVCGRNDQAWFDAHRSEARARMGSEARGRAGGGG